MKSYALVFIQFLCIIGIAASGRLIAHFPVSIARDVDCMTARLDDACDFFRLEERGRSAAKKYRVNGN